MVVKETVRIHTKQNLKFFAAYIKFLYAVLVFDIVTSESLLDYLNIIFKFPELSCRQ